MKKSPQITPESIARYDRFTLGRAFICSFLVLLGGCAALPDKPVRPAVYDFGPGLSAPLAAAPVPAAATPAQAPLALAGIEAPAAFDGTAVLYRLAYADVQQLRPYAQARWSMPPAQLVRQRLRERLSPQRAVLNPGEGAAGQTLRLELEEFSQVFDAPERASALVRLRATLVETRSGRERLLAQRSFSAREPAPTADAPGGVRALTAATDSALADIAQWLQQQSAP
jgi:cholesterol transport system auxiliary component